MTTAPPKQRHMECQVLSFTRDSTPLPGSGDIRAPSDKGRWQTGRGEKSDRRTGIKSKERDQVNLEDLQETIGNAESRAVLPGLNPRYIGPVDTRQVRKLLLSEAGS